MNSRYSNLEQKLIGSDASAWRRTSSGRTVKRKKFDDEIIESGFKKDKHKISSLSNAGHEPLPQESCTVSHSSSLQTLSPQTLPEHNPPSKANEIDLWTPEDHLKLIYAVQQTCDLEVVHSCTRFSHSFSADEVRTRWKCLLLDPQLSKQYTEKLPRIHPGVVRRIQNASPPNKLELQALKNIPFDSNPNLEVFQKLMEGNRDVFQFFRLPQRLAELWYEMRELEGSSDVMDFHKMVAEAEFGSDDDDENDDGGDDSDAAEKERIRDEMGCEMLKGEAAEREEIVRLERGAHAWKQAMHPDRLDESEFDENTYAILKTQDAVYKMKSLQILVGKKVISKPQQQQQQHGKQQQQQAEEADVDVDLSSHVMSHKISRKHFSIRLLHRSTRKGTKDTECNEDNMEFELVNLSRRSVFVNHREVKWQQRCPLPDHSSVEISNFLNMTFHIHKELLQTLTHPASSSTTISSSSSSAIFSN